MAAPKLTEDQADAIMRAVLEAAEDLPPQGWMNIRRENDGSLSALLKVGCHPFRLRLPPPGSQPGDPT